ncbi:glycosyltransferase family 2 protein, partial [Saccharothrix sp. MB29]|nr:glycosyltransferase family 2 protein [Saccharothrix sp. MB29]
MTSGAAPRLRTAPVLAVLVCHDGERWLGTALSALRRQRPRPRHVIAVDTGSVDGTAKLLADAAEGTDRVIDGVLTLPRGTGFGEAVHAAVEHAVQRWGDPGSWLWLLHDDCAPEPDCLSALLTAAEVSPSAAVLGPLALDWADPRLVVEAGLSTDSSGHRQTGIDGPEPVASGYFEQSTEALAVPSAGSLVRRAVWEALDGYDRSMPLLGDDVDFGWRVNLAGHLVLSVPVARMRHARALVRGERRLDAAAARPGPALRGVDRAHGLRTFLVNCGTTSFLVGLPRLAVLAVLRALGFVLLRRFADAHAEVGALRYLLSGRARLLAGRAERPAHGVLRGLFTSRVTRLRNTVRAASAHLIRRRVEADLALGRLSEDGARGGLVALLFLADAPLAGLAAYAATRRVPVRRPVRALVAAAYALLPAATSAVSQGRLDVVVVHLLVPVVFAGVVSVLRGGTGAAWLPVASGTALAVAALGAFSPLVHGLVALGALVGFVVVPGRAGDGRRRVASLFVVVLLPVALLLPWPAVVLQNPSVVLHGVGAFAETPVPGLLDLSALRPGGTGALPFVGFAVVAFALLAAVTRPNRSMLAGVAAVVLGGFAVIVLRTVSITPLPGGPAQPGWTGGALLVVGWGLLWVVLAAFRRDAAPVPFARVVSAVGVVAVVGLACSGFAGLRTGALTADAARLPSTVEQELPRTGRSVLVIGAPTRLVAGRLPAFGDDDLVPVATATTRLARWSRDLTGGDPAAARTALAQVAASGGAFVVVPDLAAARRLRDAAGDLVAVTPAMSDGRPVLRVQLAAGNAVLLSPELARRARTGGNPPVELGAPGTAPVEAAPPEVGVQVSEGPEGRLLVLAAEEEPGWRATVDGREVATVRAWGHLVG